MIEDNRFTNQSKSANESFRICTIQCHCCTCLASSRRMRMSFSSSSTSASLSSFSFASSHKLDSKWTALHLWMIIIINQNPILTKNTQNETDRCDVVRILQDIGLHRQQALSGFCIGSKMTKTPPCLAHIDSSSGLQHWCEQEATKSCNIPVDNCWPLQRLWGFWRILGH